MRRIEYTLRKGCFGIAAWQDIFFRDMRAVKKAFAAVGLDLMYSRTNGFHGYYVNGQDAHSSEFKKMIQSSVGEVDLRQIEIFRSLSLAARFTQGCAISDTARNVVAYRIKQHSRFVSSGSPKTGTPKGISISTKKILNLTGYLNLLLTALKASRVEYMLGGARTFL